MKLANALVLRDAEKNMNESDRKNMNFKYLNHDILLDKN